VDADIVEYTLGKNGRAVGRRLSQMALPDGTVVAMITRKNEVIPPRGSTALQAGDHLFVVLRPETRPFVDSVFSQALEAARNDLPSSELRLKGSTTLEAIRCSYGISLGADDHLTLEALLRQSLTGDVQVGESIVLDGVMLTVRDMIDARMVTISLTPESN